jgi:hypothetical protein
MRFKYWKTGSLLIGILLLVLITPNSFAGNYDQTYSFQVQFGLLSQKLYISVPPSLYDYYHAKTHRLADDSQYATLVTPDAFKSIAENIQNLTRDKPRSDEEFANAVLMLVHQIPYNISDVKYPIETLVENSGKCDTLSLLAASIMKAGGLDVVLLYFKEVHHINVGVYLPYEPHGSWWWLSPTGYVFNGKKYWIAECTPAMDWKVGDVPPLLAGEQPCIIPLENSEAPSPSYVSSKLGSPLNSSSISINLSSDPSGINYNERMLTILGSISPGYQNETVVVYFSQDGISYDAYRTVTDYWGNYSFSWNFTSTGTYYIRTSWSGNPDCAGADSEILTVFIGFPESLVQFKIPPYYYTSSPARTAAHELRVIQGVEDFLDIQLSGTGVVLTGEFIILKGEQNTSSIQMETITIPEMEQTFRLGRQRVTIRIPPKTALVPTIPEDMRAIRLPDDIEQTTHNQFSIILRNSGGNNYTLNVRGLDDYEMAEINPLGGNGTAFMNITGCIRDSKWYRVVARISEDKITAELHDADGKLVESIATPDAVTNINELLILVANNTHSAVVFKNLNIETLKQATQPVEGDKEAVTGNESLALNVTLVILLATVFAVVVHKRRKSWRKIG